MRDDSSIVKMEADRFVVIFYRIKKGTRASLMLGLFSKECVNYGQRIQNSDLSVFLIHLNCLF